jgi:hypothetical protein
MLGPKKLSEIKQELRQLLATKDSTLESWLQQQLVNLQPQPPRDAKLLEDLLWVRDLLRETSRPKKPAGGKTRKRRAKETPAT